MVIEGHRFIGQASIYVGQYEQSLQSFDTAIELLSKVDREKLGHLKGVDVESFCLSQSSHVAWYLGYPDQAVARAREARERANLVSHPFSKAMSYFLGCLVHFYCGEEEEAFRLAKIGVEISEEYGLAMFKNEMNTLVGLSMFAEGQAQEGIDTLRKVREWREKNNLVTAFFLHICLQLEGYQKIDNHQGALRLIEEADKYQQISEDRLGFSEVLRIKADLLLETEGESAYEEARGLLQQSRNIAIDQQAKAFELRTAISTARFHQQNQ